MPYMPFETTTKSVNDSASRVVALLEDLGFDEVGQFSKKGHKIVIAVHKGIQFRFEANADEIFEVLRSAKPRTNQEWLRSQSYRIAWRLLWNQVKNSCDVIRYKALDIAQVFGGYLVFDHPEHGKVGLAQLITQQVETGKLLPMSILGEGTSKERQ